MNAVDDDRKTPLAYATETNNVECLDYLVSQGADPLMQRDSLPSMYSIANAYAFFRANYGQAFDPPTKPKE